MDGGALVVQSKLGYEVNVSYCLFHGCAVYKGATYGGAIFVDGEYLILKFKNSSFEYCQANNGVGIYIASCFNYSLE
jgi:hypothetical protein